MMQNAAVHAVLATLARATVDSLTPVVVRTRRPQQARDLARWLARVHGSDRTVIASVTAPALIEVRLPARLDWHTVLFHDEMMTALAAA
jgi:hypothetical protein